MKRLWGLSALVGLLLAAVVLAGANWGNALGDEPRLGIRGTLIDLSPRVGIPAPEGLPNRAIRVDAVYSGTPAARMGLERGDLIISIDSMRFTSYAGYFHALRCADQRPSLLLRDVRTGRLLHRSVYLPHSVPPDWAREPRYPDTYWMAIDLAREMFP